MRIGIDAEPANHPESTGVEVYAHRLLVELVRLDADNRYNLYFKTAPRPHLPRFPDNFVPRVIRAPLLWHQLRLPLALARDRNDVFLFPVHQGPLLPVPGRVVTTIHDTAFLHARKDYPPIHRQYLAASTRILARKADIVIAISHATAADVRRDYGLPADRIRVIHQGWDPELAAPVGDRRLQAARERYGLTRPYLLSIGSLRPGKNILRLIEAYARMIGATAPPGSTAEPARGGAGPAKTPAEHDLVLAGKDDWPKGATARAVRDAGLDGRVHITGYVPRDVLTALLQGAAAFVFPSLHEGFGVPPLEAMGAGVPVITSRVGSIPEVVGDAARAIDPYDPVDMARGMTEVLADASVRARMIEAGRKQAARFSWAATARATLEVLREAGAS